MLIMMIADDGHDVSDIQMMIVDDDHNDMVMTIINHLPSTYDSR
jgi:hypothetical protein